MILLSDLNNPKYKKVKSIATNMIKHTWNI